MRLQLPPLQQLTAPSQPAITAADIARWGLSTHLQVTTARLTVQVSAERVAMRQGIGPFLSKPPGL